MTTHVIILAQGMQSRLPKLTVDKQMLPLPACNDTPILYRTFRQIFEITGGCERTSVCVVCWLPLAERLYRDDLRCRIPVSTKTLRDPGNSSLKGVKQALDARLRYEQEVDCTVVLLGDVVYSWAALRSLLTGTNGAHFFGTPDLSPSDGELFGVRWFSGHEPYMIDQLDRALIDHPKFKAYQPGQMRRWIVGSGDWTQDVTDWSSYFVINDYTDDVDVPADVFRLPETSQLAAADDRNHGVIW